MNEKVKALKRAISDHNPHIRAAVLEAIAAAGLASGPFKQTLQSVNALYPRRPFNPMANLYERPDNTLAKGVDARFPYVLTTYRLTEQHTAGGMSRWLSHLAELQPEMFCEISPQLALELGLENGAWMTQQRAPGARVLVSVDMSGTPFLV